MKTKIKMTLLTALFFFGLLVGLQAQDKYEYAIVSNFDLTRLCVIKHTAEYPTFPKGSDNWGELTKKVEEMNKEGWEVYNTAPTFNSYGTVIQEHYYMRRKLKE